MIYSSRTPPPPRVFSETTYLRSKSLPFNLENSFAVCICQTDNQITIAAYESVKNAGIIYNKLP